MTRWVIKAHSIISVEVGITFWYLCTGVSFFWQLCTEQLLYTAPWGTITTFVAAFPAAERWTKPLELCLPYLTFQSSDPFLLFLRCPCGQEQRPEPGRSSCPVRNRSREAALGMKKNNEAWVTGSDVKSWGEGSGRVPSARVRTATRPPHEPLTPRNLLAGPLSFSPLCKTRAPMCAWSCHPSLQYSECFLGHCSENEKTNKHTNYGSQHHSDQSLCQGPLPSTLGLSTPFWTSPP